MKRILTIQDLSCIGRCSLTAAVPVLSAMGLETAVLPTAVLSSHTAFSCFSFRDLSGDIPAILDAWEKSGQHSRVPEEEAGAKVCTGFDGILSGYLGTCQQAALVKEVWRRFGRRTDSSSKVSSQAAPEAVPQDPGRNAAASDQPALPVPLRLVDPAMADHGMLYAGLDETFVQAMKSLVAQADVTVPNLTEACLLTGTPYQEDPDRMFCRELLMKLSENGPRICVLTGYTGREKESTETGVLGALAYDSASGTFYEKRGAKIPHSFYGTGDLFASVFFGSLVRGSSLPDALSLAVDFLEECMQKTLQDPSHRWYGVNFEQALPFLIRRISS